MRLPCSLLPVILLVLAPVASAGENEKALFTEAFTDKLADGWTWVREDAKGWRLDKGTLIVHLHRRPLAKGQQRRQYSAANAARGEKWQAGRRGPGRY